MRRKKWIVGVSGLAVAVAIVIGSLSHAQVAGSRSLGKAITNVDPVAHLTRVQLDVFELTCSYDQLASFELDRIGAGRPTATEVTQRLEEFGDARVLLRYDNVVDLIQETTISNGLHVPAIENIAISGDDTIVPSVNFERVGFSTSLSGLWLDDHDPVQARISLRMECSGVADANMRVAENVDVPVFIQRFMAEESRVLRSGEPIWIACNELNLRPNEDGTVTMTVVRLTATRLTDA